MPVIVFFPVGAPRSHRQHRSDNVFFCVFLVMRSYLENWYTAAAVAYYWEVWIILWYFWIIGGYLKQGEKSPNNITGRLRPWINLRRLIVKQRGWQAVKNISKFKKLDMGRRPVDDAAALITWSRAGQRDGGNSGGQHSCTKNTTAVGVRGHRLKC